MLTKVCGYNLIKLYKVCRYNGSKTLRQRVEEKYKTPHFTPLKFEEEKKSDYPPQTFVTYHFTTLKLKAWTFQFVKTTFDCKKNKTNY